MVHVKFLCQKHKTENSPGQVQSAIDQYQQLAPFSNLSQLDPLDRMDLQTIQLNPGLGNLSRLPVEIRLEIWDQCSLDIFRARDRYLPRSMRPATYRYGFLCASRTVYNEASDFVYRKTILRFTSSGSPDRLRWLSVSSNTGFFMDFGGIEEALNEGFDRIPWSKFKQIQVQIEPPDTTDPGSLMMIWLRNVHIAELLAMGEHESASILIDLMDEPEFAWEAGPDKDGKASNILLRNEINYPNRPLSILRPDFEVVLVPFRRLRQFVCAEVCYPEAVKGAKELANELVMLLTREEPFGAYCDPKDDALSDQNIQRAFQDLKSHMCIAWRSFRGKTTNVAHADPWYGPVQLIQRLEYENGSWITTVYNEVQKGKTGMSKDVSTWRYEGGGLSKYSKRW